jgi:hypothetical protein
MTKIDMDTASGQRGRYANLSRLLGEFRCCRFLRDGKSADGIIVGLWTADDGTPQCVVLTADGCLNRINLEKVRISNAQVKVSLFSVLPRARQQQGSMTAR